MTETAAATFRRAGPADAPAIAALHAASWRTAYRRTLTDAYLDGPIYEERARLWEARLGPQPGGERCYVGLAETGGAPALAGLAGFACILLNEEPAWGASLDNLHVRLELQGQGIGRQLFARAVQWVMAVETGGPLHLWMYEANIGARPFYDALGGEIAQRGLKHAADGSQVPSLRYVWRDLEVLLGRLTA